MNLFLINFYKAVVCILSLFSTCKSKLPDTIIIVFPEIGINATEYQDILPNNIHKLYLNIWTNEQFDKLKDIEKYTTKTEKLEYEKWFTNIVLNSKSQIINEMKKYSHTIPKTIFFSHSFGTYIANRLKSHADLIITYGGIIKPNFVKTFNLLGTEDEFILSNYQYWPRNAIPMVNMNHYSCVNLESKKKSLKWNKYLFKYLNLPKKCTEEKELDDKRYIINREITRLTKKI